MNCQDRTKEAALSVNAVNYCLKINQKAMFTLPTQDMTVSVYSRNRLYSCCLCSFAAGTISPVYDARGSSDFTLCHEPIFWSSNWLLDPSDVNGKRPHASSYPEAMGIEAAKGATGSNVKLRISGSGGPL